MDFIRNESQQELAALGRRILDRPGHAGAAARGRGGGDRFDPALWADLAGAGILAAALPESLGGAGLGLLEQCSVLAEIGRAVAPVPYLASIVLGRRRAGPVRHPRTSSSAGRRPRAAASSSSRPRCPRRTATTRGPRRPPPSG